MFACLFIWRWTPQHASSPLVRQTALSYQKYGSYEPWSEHLTHKQLEIRQCILSTVATDALVLKHLGPVSISDKTSYCMISSLEPTRLGVTMLKLLWNFAVTSTFRLMTCLPNFRATGKQLALISWLQYFTMFYNKTSYTILKYPWPLAAIIWIWSALNPENSLLKVFRIVPIPGQLPIEFNICLPFMRMEQSTTKSDANTPRISDICWKSLGHNR